MEFSQTDESALQEWVRLAQEGDTGAFEKLYGHFFPSVYRYASFRLPQAVAEDITADIFVKAWEKLGTYSQRKGVPFGAWLFRIARYSVIDAHRTHKDWDSVPEDLQDSDALNRAESRLERGEKLKTVRAAMEKLPKKYREILLLSFMADLPHSEIARVLRISEGSVRIQKFRALQKLEALLPPDSL